MKIIHCFYSLTVGGAEILAVDLLNQMCAEHQCSLVIVNSKWSRELLTQLDKRVKVYFINRTEGSRNPLPLLRFNALLLTLRPNIIHCHEPKMAQIIKLGGAKLIYTIHDTGIATDTYHLYHYLAAISQAVYNDVAARFNGKMTIVYNGINAAHFAARRQYSLDGEPVRVVQVSRVVHQKKGQDILLRALALLQKEPGAPAFTLDFVGVGPSMEYLKSLAAELGLSQQVRFVGERNREWLYQHLCDYHLLVQPSRFEGFGLTILEGFAAGLPVLASGIEGPAEIINQTPRGWLFEKENVQDCAARLREIIERYQTGALARIIETTKPLTDTRYSIQACAQGYLDVYQKALQNQS